MLLDTDRIERFICASRSTTALTGMAAVVLRQHSGRKHVRAAVTRLPDCHFSSDISFPQSSMCKQNF